MRYDSDVHGLELLQFALLVTAVSGFDSPIKDDEKFSTSFAYVLYRVKTNAVYFSGKVKDWDDFHSLPVSPLENENEVDRVYWPIGHLH